MRPHQLLLTHAHEIQTSSVFVGLLLLALNALTSAGMEPLEAVTFPSEDNLSVTADFYPTTIRAQTPIIVLFHQVNWSRTEYPEIAPRLQDLGLQALAVGQRSGNAVNGVTNHTAQQAKADGLGTSFIDALPNMRAALRHAISLTSGPILSWGSSYSSALILKVAADDPSQADGVLSFSPSEYFPDRQLIQKAVINLTVPTFITSARSEANNYAAIVQQRASRNSVDHLLPVHSWPPRLKHALGNDH
ncbi:MAG: hypothetical protein GWQ05_15160 [Verrucomicrobiaceae bacterium]|nr:hypothetical protein [Verrucomicrobiaceae bacterium]